MDGTRVLNKHPHLWRAVIVLLLSTGGLIVMLEYEDWIKAALPQPAGKIVLLVLALSLGGIGLGSVLNLAQAVNEMTVQDTLAHLQAKTGHTMEEWLAMLAAERPEDDRAAARWLREMQGLDHDQVVVILRAAESRASDGAQDASATHMAAIIVLLFVTMVALSVAMVFLPRLLGIR